MNAANMSRPWSLTLLAIALAVFSVATASGGPSSPESAVVRAQGGCTTPKVVSKTHQPAGKPQKASSFAPHPTKRRVFGAPIQPPILGRAPPKEQPPK